MDEHTGPKHAQASDQLVATMLIVVMLAIGTLFGLFAYELLRINSDENSTTMSLCALRADIQRRITGGAEFLVSHPHGIPGISAGTIRVSITNEEASLRSLAALHCGPTGL